MKKTLGAQIIELALDPSAQNEIKKIFTKTDKIALKLISYILTLASSNDLSEIYKYQERSESLSYELLKALESLN